MKKRTRKKLLALLSVALVVVMVVATTLPVVAAITVGSAAQDKFLLELEAAEKVSNLLQQSGIYSGVIQERSLEEELCEIANLMVAEEAIAPDPAFRQYLVQMYYSTFYKGVVDRKAQQQQQMAEMP